MTDLQGFKSALGEAQSILIFLPASPSQDAVAAALSLYLSLQKSGKQTSIVADGNPIVRDSHLVGLDKLTREVGGNNLVITFNLEEDAVEKVTSNTEGGHLNLVISPKAKKAIKESDLSFSYSGAQADLIIVVGAGSLQDLGPIYEKEIELFERAKIVNFGMSSGNFGAINFADPSSSSSELTAATIAELKLPMDQDIAGNLLLGIEDATLGLTSPNMTADTFEALAVLYRHGAKRSVKTDLPQAKVIQDIPIAKEDLPNEAREKDEAKADWLKPKIMKSSGK